MNDVFDDIRPENNTKPYQECVSCGQSGHTYLACPKINFFEALLVALYTPPKDKAND